MSLKWLLAKIRHKLRSLIDTHPIVYLPLRRVRSKTRHIIVSKDTEIVIEGFPRSVNTFAVVAFTFAQGRPVKIARHLHAPAQVIAAVRREIPCIVLIRKPRDAVLSLLVRAPHISADQALKDYIRFYREETVARPSAYREKLKKRVEAKLDTPKARRLLLEAEEVYRMFIEGRESVVS